jgi:hypothetical protein
VGRCTPGPLGNQLCSFSAAALHCCFHARGRKDYEGILYASTHAAGAVGGGSSSDGAKAATQRREYEDRPRQWSCWRYDQGPFAR